eukprot:g8771.t1
MSDSGSVVQPVPKSRIGRQTASASVYHPSKSQLIDWVNQILLLGITRLEEFASGAVYCQTFDAFYINVVPIYRVNFHAKEEYEFVPNYKILQGSFAQLKINRDMNVQKLMRGAPSETLEFLQWMYKILKKQKIIVNYDPFERRLRSYKGGTDRIPMPYWMHSHFDVFGRPDASTHRRTGTNLDHDVPEDRRSRHARTPGPQIGSGGSRSSRHTPHTRTTSADGRNYTTEITAVMREMQGSRRTQQDSMEPKVSKERLKTRTSHSSKSPLTPASRSEEASSKAFSVNIRAVENSGNFELPTAPLTPTTGGSSVNSAEEAVIAVRRSLETLKSSIPNFKSLIEDLGTDCDSYAYRGKLRGLKDVISILIRHNHLLIEELEKLLKSNQLEKSSDDENQSTFRGFPACVQQISDLEFEFETSLQHLTELETRNPVPRNCSLIMTKRQNNLSDTVAIDKTLRRIGAAQANLIQPPLNFNNRSISTERSQSSTPTFDRVRSLSHGVQPESSIPKVDPTTQAMPQAMPPSVFKDGDYQIRRLKNGDIYKGRYEHSKKNGEGVYLFSVGDTYEGNFIDDKMNGFGVYTFAVEGRYEGEWRNSMYEGVGTETFARGSTYHGEYANGMRHGWGACRYFGGAYYEGEWRHGLREGRGMQQCVDGSNYTGEYLAGKRHGYGVYCFPNGDRYIGEYERDIPHGYGVYTFITGQKYEGQWRQGKKHGWCVYTIESGEMWAGEWSDGKPTWIQALSQDDHTMDPRWPEEVCKKVEIAWIACTSARSSEAEASDKADDHWKAEGDIQRSIVHVRAQAEKAVMKSQETRKKAIGIAEKLDALVAEQETKA